jgi:hypothetical protein
LEGETSAETDILGLIGIVAEQGSEAGGTAGWLTPPIEAKLFIEVAKKEKYVCLRNQFES